MPSGGSDWLTDALRSWQPIRRGLPLSRGPIGRQTAQGSVECDWLQIQMFCSSPAKPHGCIQVEMTVELVPVAHCSDSCLTLYEYRADRDFINDLKLHLQ